MKRLRLQTNVLIVTVTIFCYCHSNTIIAEEAGVQSKTTIEQTPTLALAASQNGTTAAEETEQTTEQSAEQPATVIQTPQPPLIDAQQSSAEPGNIDGSDTEETSQDITDKSEQAAEWSDLRPYHVAADWVQLKSGEWLRGRIIAMQDFRLEFYSDELKKLTLKWRNVKYI